MPVSKNTILAALMAVMLMGCAVAERASDRLPELCTVESGDPDAGVLDVAIDGHTSEVPDPALVLEIVNECRALRDAA